MAPLTTPSSSRPSLSPARTQASKCPKLFEDPCPQLPRELQVLISLTIILIETATTLLGSARGSITAPFHSDAHIGQVLGLQ